MPGTISMIIKRNQVQRNSFTTDDKDENTVHEQDSCSTTKYIHEEITARITYLLERKRLWRVGFKICHIFRLAADDEGG